MGIPLRNIVVRREDENVGGDTHRIHLARFLEPSREILLSGK
jgi:hypothetical protein